LFEDEQGAGQGKERVLDLALALFNLFGNGNFFLTA